MGQERGTGTNCPRGQLSQWGNILRLRFVCGCNRRWELAGLNAAVLRQQMGHSSSAMTALYTGKIPLEQIRTAFSNGSKIVVLENMENAAAA
jgi:hypothetical protein